MQFTSFTAGCWAVFIIYWMLAARGTKRTAEVGPSRWIRPVGTILIGLTFAL